MRYTRILALSCAAACATALATAATVGSSSAAVKRQPGSYITPFQPAGLSTALQGIKGADRRNTYYIVGTGNGSEGLVYEGPASKKAVANASRWTTMNVPASWNAAGTSIYGVNNLSGGNVDLVGTYNTGDLTTNGNGSFFYSGPVTGAPDAADFTPFKAKDKRTGATALFTFLHSVSGGLVVGNYDLAGDNNPAGHAFIFDPSTGRQIAIKYPRRDRALTHSAYGIWWNGGRSYTIAGGTSRGRYAPQAADGDPLGDATLIDYNSRSKRFTHFRKFEFPTSNGRRSPISHFEGIWTNGTGTYKLPVTTVTKQGATAAIATVHRRSNKTFGPAGWRRLKVPGSSLFATNDSIFAHVSVGEVNVGGVQSYAFRAR